MKKILWRCDDFGSASGANLAILALARLGLPINVSVMIVGPDAQDGLAELAALKNVCLGVHSAVTSEWSELKWGPVGTVRPGSQLVDAKGHFHPNYDIPGQIPPEEIAAEAEAQVVRAKTWGIPFRYLDEHMVYGWMPGIQPLLADVAARHGLIYDHDLAWLPDVPEKSGDLVTDLGRAIELVPENVPTLAVFHPAFDDASTQRYVFDDGESGVIARERQLEADAFRSPAWRELMTGRGVQLMTYRDLR